MRGNGTRVPPPEASLGDLVIVLLASTLAGLRDRLHGDGFEKAADLVADLVDVADHWLTSGWITDEETSDLTEEL